MIVLRVALGIAGAVLALGTLLSAVRTVVVPRAESVALTRGIFRTLRLTADRIARMRDGFEWTDRVMSLYAPVALLSLPLAWLTLVYLGFVLLFWAAGEGSFLFALDVSGSSLLTLGFTRPTTVAGHALAFTGAALVLAIIVLLLVTYLPTMYAAFAERERLVTKLAARAGSPPTGIELIERFARIQGLGQLTPMWQDWEDWFAAVEESHTSQPALVFFRSPQPQRSWITAAGALLDAASLYVACIDHEQVAEYRRRFAVQGFGGPEDLQQVRMPQAEICIRAGYLCLRQIASYFDLPFDPDPDPTDPIAITRDEFDDAWSRFAAAGAPLVDDPDEAWIAFAGWRVNYDEPLLRLADIAAAPDTPWVSDRSPPLTTGRKTRRLHRLLGRRRF